MMRSTLHISDSFWDLVNHYSSGEWNEDIGWYSVMVSMCHRFHALSMEPNSFYMSEDEIEKINEIRQTLMNCRFAKMSKDQINAHYDRGDYELDGDS